MKVEPLGESKLLSNELSQTAAVRFKAERHLKYRQLITVPPRAEVLRNWVNQSILLNQGGANYGPGAIWGPFSFITW